tara:strand:- start:361 stop:1098 length:738 start_codon:yes stop_codon:yes gene_type:complete
MNIIPILTHHKTGTTFWRELVSDIFESQNIIKINRKNIYKFDELVIQSNDSDAYRILLDSHSLIDREFYETNKLKGIHSFRNPKNILISATRYHQKSKEKWLHRPQERFDGKTYQQKINSFNNLENKIIFEMNNSSKKIIKSVMKVFKYDNFYNVDLDKVSTDSSMEDLKSIYNFLDIKTKLNLSQDDWLEVCAKHCLWNIKNIPSHVTSSSPGNKENIDEYFTNNIKDEFLSIFGEDSYHNTFG